MELGAKRPQESASDCAADELGSVKRAKLEEYQDESADAVSKNALGFRRGRINYDAVGVLRTKPGRVDSEPTMSMSCSDKIARWNILGLTSALVAPFLAPIYLSSVITKELFDTEALERALFQRMKAGCEDIGSQGSYKLHHVRVHSTEIVFEHSKDEVAQSLKEGNSTAVASASSKSVRFDGIWKCSLQQQNLTSISVNRYFMDSQLDRNIRSVDKWMQGRCLGQEADPAQIKKSPEQDRDAPMRCLSLAQHSSLGARALFGSTDTYTSRVRCHKSRHRHRAADISCLEGDVEGIRSGTQ